MRYETISVDRRNDYYVRSAALIAADPLDFYTRAERGRRWQAETFYMPREYEREAIATSGDYS